MQQNSVAKREPGLDPEIERRLITEGDLSGLNKDQRVAYYQYRCRQLALDPAEKPFDILELQGRTVLYANKSCANALCRTRGIKREIVTSERVGDLYIVTARATDKEGRSDEDTGAVSLVKEVVTKWGRKNGKSFPEEKEQQPLSPEDVANAIMKATTKAKRRAVLSLCGLGEMDESEVEAVRSQGTVTQVAATPEAKRNDVLQRFYKVMRLNGEDPKDPTQMATRWKEFCANLGYSQDYRKWDESQVETALASASEHLAQVEQPNEPIEAEFVPPVEEESGAA